MVTLFFYLSDKKFIDEFLQTQMSKSNTVLDANFLDEKQVTLYGFYFQKFLGLRKRRKKIQRLWRLRKKEGSLIRPPRKSL